VIVGFSGSNNRVDIRKYLDYIVIVLVFLIFIGSFAKDYMIANSTPEEFTKKVVLYSNKNIRFVRVSEPFRTFNYNYSYKYSFDKFIEIVRDGNVYYYEFPDSIMFFYIRGDTIYNSSLQRSFERVYETSIFINKEVVTINVENNSIIGIVHKEKDSVSFIVIYLIIFIVLVYLLHIRVLGFNFISLFLLFMLFILFIYSDTIIYLLIMIVFIVIGIFCDYYY